MHAPAQPHFAVRLARGLARRLLLTASAVLAAAGADAGQRLRLQQRLLELLAQGLRTTLITALIGPALIAWLTLPSIGPVAAMAPALLLYALSVERLFFLRRLARGRWLPAQGLRAITWRTGLSACVVATWGYPVVTAGNDTLVFVILALATIVSASSVTQMCCWPPAMWASFTPILLGLGAQLLLFGDSNGLFAAAFTLLLWATLGMAGLRFARTLHSDLLTRQRNESLVAELREKRAQAEAANAAKSRFLAAASHDLRQPVHAMQLLGAALTEQLAGTPQAPLMRHMAAGVASFAELVDEVMDLARVDAGAVQAHLAPVPAHAMLARAEAAFRASAQARGLALWLRLPQRGAPPVVLADAALLWRVVGNLLANAVRYTPTGAVLLAVRRARTDAGAPAWRFEVRDSGPGIPAHQHQAVFEEFYQAHGAQHGTPHGTPAAPLPASQGGHGLGLAVAQRLARLMGSQVRLHPCSTRGAGAVFSITLPAAAAPGAAPQAAPAPAPFTPPALHGLRVLVVDDDPAACLALRSLLHGWGAQAHSASDVPGAAAVAAQAAARGQPLQALICDHWLAGGARSHHVLAAVRTHAPALRVAVVSGGAGGEDIAALQRAGATFWRKPLSPRVLAGWLTRTP